MLYIYMYNIYLQVVHLFGEASNHQSNSAKIKAGHLRKFSYPKKKFLRKIQQTPGTYPRPSTTWRRIIFVFRGTLFRDVPFGVWNRIFEDSVRCDFFNQTKNHHLKRKIMFQTSIEAVPSYFSREYFRNFPILQRCFTWWLPLGS